VAEPRVEGADNLCDLLVFVEDACGVVASADAEGLQVGGVLGQGSQRCGLAERPVWAVWVGLGHGVGVAAGSFPQA